MASLDTQYRFDRTLERGLPKEERVGIVRDPPALLGKYMKSDGYYWIGGSWVYGSGRRAKVRLRTQPMQRIPKVTMSTLLSPATHRRHPSSVPKKRRPISTTSSVGRPRIDLVIPHAHRVSNFIRDSQTFIRKPPLHARIVLHDLIDVVAGFAEQRIATEAERAGLALEPTRRWETVLRSVPAIALITSRIEQGAATANETEFSGMNLLYASCPPHLTVYWRLK